MPRAVKNVRTLSLFHDHAGIHDRDILRQIRHNAQVMGDNDNGCIMLLLQILDDIQNLPLDSHIQRRRRLVADQKLRVTGKGDGDHDTLAHTAGKFMRVLLHPLLRLRDADHTQHFHRFLLRRFFIHVLMGHQIFHNLLSHTHGGI